MSEFLHARQRQREMVITFEAALSGIVVGLMWGVAITLLVMR